MKYITTIEALEELEAAKQTDGIMLVADDCLLQGENARLLLQSLFLDPPQNLRDPRLDEMLRLQTEACEREIQACTQMQLCVRLPDSPIDDILPTRRVEFSRLSEYASRPVMWLEEKVQAIKEAYPSYTCRGSRLMAAHDQMFRVFIRSLFTAAQNYGIRKMSVLFPFVVKCHEIHQLREQVVADAARFDIDCTVGLEIATPNAVYYAADLTDYADVMIFNVDELTRLLYGDNKRGTKTFAIQYLNKDVFRNNPFTEFGDVGIATLLGVALQNIRHKRPKMRVGATGYPVLTENGRKFCLDMGIDMLIAPPYLFELEQLIAPIEEKPKNSSPQ